jgi:hypothetical protein
MPRVRWPSPPSWLVQEIIHFLLNGWQERQGFIYAYPPDTKRMVGEYLSAFAGCSSDATQIFLCIRRSAQNILINIAGAG